LEDAKSKTQILEKNSSAKVKKMDVSRPTTVTKESEVYMLVGRYSGKPGSSAEGNGADDSGLLLVKGDVSGDEESNKKIDWKSNTALPRTIFGEKHNSLTGLVGGGGSGIETKDGKLVFPVEGTKKKDNTTDVKIVSLIISSLKDTNSWTLSNEISADGCSDPSVVEWKDGKLMMMTACDDGPRRVYESGDKGDSWTEALGTLSRVWGNKHEGPDKGVRSGFITA
ncbi:trans-sialidase, putative, partial [Trypanosoma cruzi marinkellei]